MLNAPLEQFELIPFNYVGNVFVSYFTTNFLLTNVIAILLLTFFIVCNNSIVTSSTKTVFFYFMPNNWQKSIENLTEIATQILTDNITSNHNEKYLPLLTTIFNFILLNNLIGLLPYSTTITSHVIITLSLSFSIFIGINILLFEKYQLKAFSLFMPSNSTFFLALLLVPIELVTYIAKPISLGVRLFINMMAGHSLLKIVVGFSWGMLSLDGLTFLGSILPLILLVFLFGLEVVVAIIQTYVFIMLVCIYIQDIS